MAASDYTSLVQALYVAYFGRPADTFGLRNIESALNASGAPNTIQGLESAYSTNSTIKALIDSFATSSESTALYGGSSSVAFINSIYTNVLGRSADFDGLLFWSSAIDNGTLTRGNAALAITAGALSNTSAQGLVDATTVMNKITAATNFTNAIDTLAEVTGYSGTTAAAQARSFLSTVTDQVPDNGVIQNTLTTIAFGAGFNLPAPAPVTAIVQYGNNYVIQLDSNFTIAKPQSGAAPGNYGDVLSYSISDKGEISFTGTLANSLTPEQKAGEILAILKNMPGTACSFVDFDEQTQQNDTFLVCTGTTSSNPAVIELVGVAKHGVDAINIQSPMHWSS